MNRLALTDFQSLIGSTFTFQRTLEIPSLLASAGNTPVMRMEEIQAELILTSVKTYELNSRDRRAVEAGDEFRKAPFSIFFTSDQEPFLSQGMYEVHHPAFSEKQEIFIVCLGKNSDQGGYIYEAVFG